MATIKIFELRPAGSELFQDSESFLQELTDGRELDSVVGAQVFTAIASFSVAVTASPGSFIAVSPIASASVGL